MTIDELVDEMRDTVEELESTGFLFPPDSPEARLIAGVRAAIADWDKGDHEQ